MSQSAPTSPVARPVSEHITDPYEPCGVTTKWQCISCHPKENKAFFQTATKDQKQAMITEVANILQPSILHVYMNDADAAKDPHLLYVITWESYNDAVDFIESRSTELKVVIVQFSAIRENPDSFRCSYVSLFGTMNPSIMFAVSHVFKKERLEMTGICPRTGPSFNTSNVA